MIVKHFKLSQPEKDRLIRIKAKTGIQNWNVLCRWALCWSLAESSIPGGIDPLSDSNVEMDWSTFAGEYSEIYEAIIRQRCVATARSSVVLPVCRGTVITTIPRWVDSTNPLRTTWR